MSHPKKLILVSILFIFYITCNAQTVTWSADGNAYYKVEDNQIVRYTLPANDKKILISKQDLTPQGASPLKVDYFSFSSDEKKLLVFTNTQRVWRIKTRGDYWVLDLTSKNLRKLGAGLSDASLMFAKFSPDASKVAYVSDYNLYVEDLNGNIRQLTTDGTRKFINGTFDWVYEEEFACRDGFRWSTDGKSLAYWQIDARDTRDFYMINNTDSVYSRIIPVEYPKAGEDPSACRIGVIDVSTAKTSWMNIDGDPRQHYIVRLEFVPGTGDFIIQQLNRKQNHSKLIRCNSTSGACVPIYEEKDEAWVDVYTPASADNAYHVAFRHTLEWLSNGKEFLWPSEKSGWRHLYRISADGKKETPVTKGNFDVIAYKGIDEKNGIAYFLASPANATQKYLYRARLDGKGTAERLTPADLAGTHNYTISRNGEFALHTFNNTFTAPVNEWVALPAHKPLDGQPGIQISGSAPKSSATEFFKVTTSDGIQMDGWMVKPADFDPAKKYPVVFYVYTEPWGQNVTDTYGVSQNFLYGGDMRQDGYIYISLDNRGTPAPKGREWRKSIYKNIGIINIRDQAMAAKEILKWPFVDGDRIAVWGWSGGGAATLNLMFQYPDIYKTGIAIAAVSNQLTYDNIYQERYMGLPSENREDFLKGSPIQYARNLRGNLLVIHGTGDDNVHYANAEMLINELVKHDKQFQFMPYPNRSHGMSEGEGTFRHLINLYTSFLRKNCPPGPK
ncbi:MAG TPA: DPP IV N-terminal domain-containing protein [Chryseosolibacter sp.]|nr:DPP IV N-terminal domain-containing protein [Chryseosolibacter sp.]